MLSLWQTSLYPNQFLPNVFRHVSKCPRLCRECQKNKKNQTVTACVLAGAPARGRPRRGPRLRDDAPPLIKHHAEQPNLEKATTSLRGCECNRNLARASSELQQNKQPIPAPAKLGLRNRKAAYYVRKSLLYNKHDLPAIWLRYRADCIPGQRIPGPHSLFLDRGAHPTMQRILWALAQKSPPETRRRAVPNSPSLLGARRRRRRPAARRAARRGLPPR